MSLKLYYDDDADVSAIKDKKLAVIGYGSQGHAHALNLRDSGMDVKVGLAKGSASRSKAEEEGLTVLTTQEAAKWADLIMLLTPEENHKSVYEECIKEVLSAGKALAFAHGFSIHFKQVVPPEDVDVFMVAPKGPGHMVRRQYMKGSGVPSLIAVYQDSTGKARDLALSYAKALGSTRAGVVETTFQEETETDLFGEQAVLCGGLTSLIQAGFETLVEAGYSPAMAYFECVHEVKLITDLIYEGGLANMRHSISNTAEFGDYLCGPKVVDASVKERMKIILENIKSGGFSDRWIEEYENGCPNLKKYRKKHEQHLIEQVGKDLRAKIRFPESGKRNSDGKRP